jgi:hypothetical protein
MKTNRMISIAIDCLYINTNIMHHLTNLTFTPHLRNLLRSPLSCILALQIYPIMSILDAQFSNFSIHMHLFDRMPPTYLSLLRN